MESTCMGVACDTNGDEVNGLFDILVGVRGGAGAAAGVGAGGTDVMIAYKRDPRMLEHVLAMDASPLPTYTQGMTTTQQFVAKTAGLILRYPLSSSIAAGI